jgi:hypothetical protein
MGRQNENSAHLEVRAMDTSVHQEMIDVELGMHIERKLEGKASRHALASVRARYSAAAFRRNGTGDSPVKGSDR